MGLMAHFRIICAATPHVGQRGAGEIGFLEYGIVQPGAVQGKTTQIDPCKS
jgi:hypothetical protein